MTRPARMVADLLADHVEPGVVGRIATEVVNGGLEDAADVRGLSGYARIARDAPGLEERDLESAGTSARRFIDPVLTGTANGRWDPATMAWGSRE